MKIKALALTGLMASALVFGFSNSALAAGAGTSGAWGWADFNFTSRQRVNITNIKLKDTSCDGRAAYLYFQVKYYRDGAIYNAGSTTRSNSVCNSTKYFSNTYWTTSNYGIEYMRLKVCHKNSNGSLTCAYTSTYNPYK